MKISPVLPFSMYVNQRRGIFDDATISSHPLPMIVTAGTQSEEIAKK